MNDITIDKTGWKKYRFDEVCRQVNEVTKDPTAEGLDHVIGLEHIESNNLHITHWDTLEKETTFTRKFKKGQVLFGRRRAYQRKVAYAEFDGICSGDILVFEAIETVMLPELLPFLIQSAGFFQKALETSAGSLSPRTKFKELADYEFLLPPKPEQKRLAALLWAADEMIEKEKMELQCLKKHFEAYLHYGFESSNFNADLHRCIKGLIGGGTPNTKNKEYYCEFEGTPWVTSISLESIYISKGERHITQLGIKQSATNILPEGNIILGTRVGVGKCSINNVAMCFSQDSTGLIIKREIVDPVFLLFTLRSLYSQKYFKSHSRGTTIQGITKEDLLKLPIWIPDMQQQLSIAKRCTNMVMSIDISKKLLEQSQQIKKELINKII